MSDIESAISREVSKWKELDHLGIETARDINNQYCRQFAKSIRDLGYEIKIKEYGFGQSYQSFSHAWIKFNGKHYDAERPEGVSNPSDLPLFKRGEIDPSKEN